MGLFVLDAVILIASPAAPLLGLVAHARTVPAPSACEVPGMAPRRTAQAQGRAGREDLRDRLQGGHADDDHELAPHQSHSGNAAPEHRVHAPPRPHRQQR